MSKVQFEEVILKFSESLDIESALKEWYPFGPLHFLESDLQCVCGHTCKKFRWMVNLKNKHPIRVADTCFKKFNGMYAKKEYKQLNKILKNVINEGKYKIESFEDYEEMVRQEIISYYEGVIATDENSYKHLMKIKNDVEILNNVRDMKIYSEVIDIINRKMHELNKRKYLIRKQEWRDKGSLCGYCECSIKSEKEIKYSYSTKKWYCVKCFSLIE